MTIPEAYKDQTKIQQEDKKQLLAQIKEQQNRLAKARELLLSGDIEPADYKVIKTENEHKMNMLEAKLAELSGSVSPIKDELHTALNKLTQIDTLFTTGNVECKRVITSSLFPEKMIFDGSAFRTERINEAARLLYSIGGAEKGKKVDKRQIIPLVHSCNPTWIRTRTNRTKICCATFTPSDCLPPFGWERKGKYRPDEKQNSFGNFFLLPFPLSFPEILFRKPRPYFAARRAKTLRLLSFPSGN